MFKRNLISTKISRAIPVLSYISSSCVQYFKFRIVVVKS